MSEADRFFFDIFALDYYEEEYAKAVKEAREKNKFEQDHKSEAPMGFDTFQELLKQARENAGQPPEGEED
jgi:23S rRNA G2445 N2-methylase RlmL